MIILEREEYLLEFDQLEPSFDAPRNKRQENKTQSRRLDCMS